MNLNRLKKRKKKRLSWISANFIRAGSLFDDNSPIIDLINLFY